VAGSPEHGNAPSGCTKCQVLKYMGKCAVPKRQSYPCNELSRMEKATFQDTRVTEFEGMISIPRKSRTPQQRMLDRESLRTHGWQLTTLTPYNDVTKPREYSSTYWCQLHGWRNEKMCTNRLYSYYINKALWPTYAHTYYTVVQIWRGLICV